MHKRIFLTVFLIFAASSANAFFQLLALPRFAAAFATRDTAAKLATHAVGATITFLLVDTAVKSYVRLTGNNDDLPAGWTDRTTPPSTAPSTGSTSGGMYIGGTSFTFADAASADAGRDSVIARVNTNSLYPYKLRVDASKPTCTLLGVGAYKCYLQYEYQPGVWYGFDTNLNITSAIQTCPDGYALSGSSCAIANASVVRYPANGACEYVRAADGTLTPNTRDTDCAGIAPPAVPTKSIVTTDATGRAVSDTKITPLADGGTSITQQEYDWATNKTTTTTAVLNPAGTITGITTQTTTGTDTAPTAGATQSNAFPSDYAKQGTLQEISDKLVPPLPLNVAVPSLYTPGSLTYLGVLNNFQTRVGNAPAIASAKNFFSVNVSGTCPTWEIPAVMGMPSIPITAQCSPVMETVWPYIAAVFVGSVGFVAFRWAFL